MGFLRFLALLFLLAGLAALLANASLSTHYFDTMPRNPDPDGMYTVPHKLNGAVIYLTEDEDRQLYLLRHYGVRAFALGIAFGVLYLGKMATHLEKWQHSGEYEG